MPGLWKYLSETYVFFSCLAKEWHRWKTRAVDSSKGIRVYYGYDSLPTSRDISSGGVIKTQDLQAVFPNTSSRPNLLYLISSALPPYAPRMARYARRVGAKVILSQNGVAYPGWHGPGWEKTNRIMLEVLQQADHVIYQSHFCKLAADIFLQKRDDRCEILYNPVDTEIFHPLSTILPLAPVRLLLAGSHTRFYRVKTAVDTLKILKDAGLNFILEIAGGYKWNSDSDVAKKELWLYIQNKSLEDDIVLSGPYTQEEGRLMFQRSHILLHTQYNDSCPRLVVEGMASGCPIVYSASGGTQELVGAQAGVGIPATLNWEQEQPPAPVLLARGVQTIMQSYETYAAAARRRAVEQLDVNPWLKRHHDIFTRLLKES